MSTPISCRDRDSSLSRLFEDFFGTNAIESYSSNSSVCNMPRVDIVESSDSYTIKADLPGIEKKDVKITVENDVLTIEGEFSSERSKKENKYHYFERSSGKFARSFILPEGIDINRISA
ncbi:MAG: Hsp20/alpha crystallin family protein, partial [Fibrobacter sp.]|nr:Hsp20/alpha crystallin family protein [Fibrobacter sp.]